MSDTLFIHNDPDRCHGKELTLHDCLADKIMYENGILRFYFADGFWVTPNHEANSLGKTVRTDASQVDFCMDDISNIGIHVYTQSVFKKTKVEYWDASKLIDEVNRGKCTIEFIDQYRNDAEQMWRCTLRFKKKPYFKECQLYIPETTATFRWNNLRSDREW